MFEAPKGYKFAVCDGGFHKHERNNLALILSETPATCAGVFTQNLFPAAPVLISKEIMQKNDSAIAIMMNAGQANANTGEQGLANCKKTLELLASELKIDSQNILPASTGVIGGQFDMQKWEIAIPKLTSDLGKSSPEDFAKAIMTTDAFMKISEKVVELSTGEIKVLGMAKGAGMICPNMATMLCAVLTDAKVEAKTWQEMLSKATEYSFNRVTVDGDTSTNDTVFALANGYASEAKTQGDLDKLYDAMLFVMKELAYKLVQDGEGATKVIHIKVSGANSEADAEQVARTIGHSPLVKTAMYGQDANWGRIAAAIGRAGVAFKQEDINIYMCGVELFVNGQPTTLDFDSLLVDKIKERDIYLDITIAKGDHEYTLLASDLGHAYIDCNASYRS